MRGAFWMNSRAKDASEVQRRLGAELSRRLPEEDSGTDGRRIAGLELVRRDSRTVFSSSSSQITAANRL